MELGLEYHGGVIVVFCLVGRGDVFQCIAQDVPLFVIFRDGLFRSGFPAPPVGVAGVSVLPAYAKGSGGLVVCRGIQHPVVRQAASAQRLVAKIVDRPARGGGGHSLHGVAAWPGEVVDQDGSLYFHGRVRIVGICAGIAAQLFVVYPGGHALHVYRGVGGGGLGVVGIRDLDGSILG